MLKGKDHIQQAQKLLELMGSQFLTPIKDEGGHYVYTIGPEPVARIYGHPSKRKSECAYCGNDWPIHQTQCGGCGSGKSITINNR